MIPVQSNETAEKPRGAVCFHHTALRMQGISQGLSGPVQVQRYAPVAQDVHPSALARHRPVALVYRLSFQTGIVIYQPQCDALAEELAMYQSKCSRWLAFATDILQDRLAAYNGAAREIK
jgi:hypothetical protein